LVPGLPEGLAFLPAKIGETRRKRAAALAHSSMRADPRALALRMRSRRARRR
jgi:hypothetical protein